MKKYIKVAVLFLIIVISFVLFFILNREDHRVQWWFDAINCDYDINAGKNISIALIDSGIDKTHPDLENCNIEVINLLSKDQEENLKHGTAMAGVICAKPHDKSGLIGVVPSVKIYDIRVVGDENYCSIEKLINAIKIAVQKKVDIINISIGTRTDSAELKNVIDEAINDNIIVVATTSNAGQEEILYPASYEGVVKVIPINKKGEYLYGMGVNEGNIVKAPGSNIVTTLKNKDKLYCPIDGASIATAITTGTIARIIYKDPSINRKHIIEKLYEQKKLSLLIN